MANYEIFFPYEIILENKFRIPVFKLHYEVPRSI